MQPDQQAAVSVSERRSASDRRRPPGQPRADLAGSVSVGHGPVERGRTPTPLPLLVAAWTLASLSLLALWLLAFGFVLSGWNEAGAQRGLHAQVREELAAQTAPTGGKITAGSPVATLDVPRLHVHDLVVVEGTSGSVLRAGPGHRRDTPLPGQPGSAVIMGRSLLYGAPFEHVPDLRKGDAIVVVTGQGRFRYVVDGTRRGGDPVPSIKGKNARLTLVTAGSRTSGTSEREAVFVDAHLSGTPQKASSGRPTGIDADEVPMARGDGALVLVLLYLELLAAVVAGVSWAAAKWRLWPSLIVGVPLILAALWLVTDAAALLLPNLS